MDSIIEFFIELFIEGIVHAIGSCVIKLKEKRGIKKFRILDYILTFLISWYLLLIVFKTQTLIILILVPILLGALSSLVLGTISNLVLISQSSNIE